MLRDVKCVDMHGVNVIGHAALHSRLATLLLFEAPQHLATVPRKGST